MLLFYTRTEWLGRLSSFLKRPFSTDSYSKEKRSYILEEPLFPEEKVHNITTPKLSGAEDTRKIPLSALLSTKLSPSAWRERKILESIQRFEDLKNKPSYTRQEFEIAYILSAIPEGRYIPKFKFNSVDEESTEEEMPSDSLVENEEEFYDEEGSSDNASFGGQTVKVELSSSKYALTLFQNHSMRGGKKSKIKRLVSKDTINLLKKTHYVSNPYLHIESAIRTIAPILVPRQVSTSRVKKETDVQFLHERQGTSLVTKWMKNIIAKSSQNGYMRFSNNLANELMSADSEKQTAIIKKRDSLYEEVWNLYNFDENGKIVIKGKDSDDMSEEPQVRRKKTFASSKTDLVEKGK
jgi:ribosomal protein S7